MSAQQTFENDLPCLPWLWAQELEYTQHPILGGGAFAKIFTVRSRNTGQQFAMKVLDQPWYASRGMEAQCQREVEGMRRALEHGLSRYVVELLDAIEENQNVFIRMELCQCSVLDVLQFNPTNRVQESQASAWTRQLVQGLQDLHSIDVLHRDIKPENLLLAGDGTLKIADFGWCTELSSQPTDLAGTFHFMAPEVLEGQVQTEAVDVWNTGVTLFEMVVGSSLLAKYLTAAPTGHSCTDPHQAIAVRKERLLAEIRERCPLPKASRPDHTSPSCWELLQMMLQPRAKDRIQLPGALSSHWLQDSNSNKTLQDSQPLQTSSQLEPQPHIVQNPQLQAVPNQTAPALKLVATQMACAPAAPPQPLARQFSTPMLKAQALRTSTPALKEYPRYWMGLPASSLSDVSSTTASSTSNSTPEMSPRAATTLRADRFVVSPWSVRQAAVCRPQMPHAIRIPVGQNWGGSSTVVSRGVPVLTTVRTVLPSSSPFVRHYRRM
mmetsp:Transcript_23264/g.43135  ORF Transcript_23264/g.43135 Transcript_23264/m.43135 type:complete len:494 (-) Transcript_23264:113-1594(-)